MTRPWVWTRAAAVGSRRLTAWATARLIRKLLDCIFSFRWEQQSPYTRVSSCVRLPTRSSDALSKILQLTKTYIIISRLIPTTHQQTSTRNANLIVTKKTNLQHGRAVAQAVSHWLPSAVARVRVRAACEVRGGQSGTGTDFLRVLRLPLPIIPPISPSS
jgi:hypothetical protein